MTDAQPVKNPRPEHPRKNDTWVDDAGDLYTFDGEDWVPFEDEAPSFGPTSSFRDSR